ncbi:MAG: DUF420 domain-containing protein [Thermoanaerobaculia bacterium]
MQTWPALNATLNGLSAVLLVGGFVLIRRRAIRAHRAAMLAACATSLVFLVSYLLYHSQAGVTKFAGSGWSRPLYFSILTSHTILAAAIVPLVGFTLFRALKGRFALHRRLARWTLPIWGYVSVTGVLVYFFLYQWFPRF